jgi:hypothetical protein
MVGVTIAGSEIGWNPRTQRTTKHERIFERLPSPQKLCPLHTCHSTSFYREMDGLLHYDNTLRLENILSGNTYKNLLSDPQFVGPSSDIINFPCVHTLTSKLQCHSIDSVYLEHPYLLWKTSFSSKFGLDHGEDQERPSGWWMTAPQWWVIDNGCWTDSWLSA